MDEKIIKLNWHTYPQEQPSGDKQLCQYLARGVNKATGKASYFIFHWLNYRELQGWFYNGNELGGFLHEPFEWADFGEIETSRLWKCYYNPKQSRDGLQFIVNHIDDNRPIHENWQVIAVGSVEEIGRFTEFVDNAYKTAKAKNKDKQPPSYSHLVLEWQLWRKGEK